MLFLLILTLGSFFFVSLLGTVIAVPIFGRGVLDEMAGLNDLSDPGQIARLKYFQVVSQLGLFIVPCILFLFLQTRQKAEYVGLKGKLPIAHFFAAAALMIVALPAINGLLELNQLLQLPSFMSGVEDWMKASEKGADNVTTAFLSTDSVGDFILNMLMIAVVPAVGEELLFRGVLLRILRDWMKNAHIAIIVSALVFSFIHFQFYGFLPRFLMGVAFGYMLHWSGSLWVPIMAHFVNNGTAVVVAFLAARYFPDLDFNTFGSSANVFIVAGSALVCGLILTFLYLKRVRTSATPVS